MESGEWDGGNSRSLRFAPVGMTLQFVVEYPNTRMKCHPDRSAAQGPAVPHPPYHIQMEVPPSSFSSAVFYLELISRMRAVSALPGNSLNVRKSGESTTLFTTAGLLLSVAFSKIPRRPK
jgi:hypothetical protein